jgi:hypothetical protein
VGSCIGADITYETDVHLHSVISLVLNLVIGE